MNARRRTWIYALQIASVAWIWVFVIGISTWIVHLIRLAVSLDDVPGASVAISIVAIPVFLAGATVLTYVFVGLQRGQLPAAGTPGSGEAPDEGTETAADAAGSDVPPPDTGAKGADDP